MDSFRHKKRSKNQNKQEITNETDLTKTNQKKYNQDFLYSNEISNEISKENLSYDTIDFYSKDLKKTPGQFARSRQPSKKTTQTNKTFQSQYLSKQDPKNIQSSQRTLSPQNQFQDQEFNKIQQEYSPQINSPKTSLDDHQSIQDPFPKFLDLLNNFQNLIQNQNFLDQINILYQQVIDTKTQPNSKQNLVCTQIQQTYELIQMLISEKMLQIDEKKEIQSLNNTVKILVEKYQSEKQNISKNFTTRRNYCANYAKKSFIEENHFNN
ncbi:hypothetical protein M0811_14380 [Anaeramoeba ignava]|uniref:Uncharacterized protein n=1 Tax=Anaeramoeba ignava TaxID=1746090 RepID=A0A9Q0RGV2_ANAIG|nr:hypothetical protein M0811_14380 [Anaeramoeba ignava]